MTAIAKPLFILFILPLVQAPVRQCHGILFRIHRNLSLGYDISYHLNRFEYDRRSGMVLYTGSIIFNRDLQIAYYDRLSFISFLEYRVYFGQDGYFDPTFIIWTGEMSRERIADFLPYEYLPGE